MAKVRFKQILENPTGLMALAENGEIYFGCFVPTHSANLTPPNFMWRKLPPVPQDALEYEVQAEATPLELKRAIAAIESNKT